ncbi:hypothetical protein HN51_043742 [Arachis hypogaea]
MMDQIYGVLKLRIQRGINLAIRDLRSSDPYVVVSMGTQKVFDKDMFSADDEMGEAVIDIKPYVKCWNKGLEKLPDGCVVKRIQPNENNYLAEESPCIWHNGTIIQRMLLKLRNVECGELLCELEWLSVLGSMGLLELQQLHA